MHLIVYSKPGCHLGEGLQEKLEQVTMFDLDLEIRDITNNNEWFNLYQYEVPVLLQKLEQKEELDALYRAIGCLKPAQQELIELTQHEEN